MGRCESTKARRYARLMMVFQVSIWLIIGALAWVAGDLWVTLFTDERQVVLSGARLLPSCVAIIGLEGLSVVLCGIIEGTGRTRILLAATILFDIAFAVTAVALWPKRDISGFYYVWILKSLFKTAFLGILIHVQQELSHWPGIFASFRRILLLPVEGDLFCQQPPILEPIPEMAYAGLSEQKVKTRPNQVRDHRLDPVIVY